MSVSLGRQFTEYWAFPSRQRGMPPVCSSPRSLTRHRGWQARERFLTSTAPLSSEMTALAYFFGTLSVAGLFLSLITHTAALLGKHGPLGDKAFMLHGGIFVVWIPAVLIAQHLTRGTPRHNFWKVALRGCPAWIRYMTFGFFGYALLNILIVFVDVRASTSRAALADVRAFSGHWMAFYSAALAIFCSALKVRNLELKHQ